MSFGTGTNVFGANTGNTGTSIFGQPSASKPTPPLFGMQPQAQTQQPASGTSLFGGGAFGQAQQQQPSASTSLFGQPAQQQQQSTPGTSLFANPSATTTTGQQTGGLFGTAQVQQQPQQQQNAPGTSLFGNPSTTTTTGPTGGLFGTAQQQPQQQQNPLGTSLFGNPSTTTTTGQQTGGLFGTAQQQPQQQQNAPGTSLFGNPSTTTQTGGLFGSTQPQQSTSLFGSTQPQQSTGLFGSTQPQQPTSLFGSTQPQQTTSLFATKPQQTTSLFGSTQPQQQTNSLFGSTQPQQSNSLFPTTQPQQQTNSMFGSTQLQQPVGGLFGSMSTQQAAPAGGLALSTAGSSFFDQQRQPSMMSTTPISGPAPFSKSTKFNDLPDDIKRTFEAIDSHIQGRIQISNELKQRKMGEGAIKGQELIRELHKELLAVSSIIQSDSLFSKDLKAKTEQAVQDTIVATNIIEGFKNPHQSAAYLKNHASFPLEFFTRVTQEMQERLQWYKNTIEQIERKLCASASQSQNTPQAISSTLQTQHAIFVALAARTAAVDAEVQKVKALYTQLWRAKTGSMRDPFNDLDRGSGGEFGMESLQVK